MAEPQLTDWLPRDPKVEQAAIALAWCDRTPAFLPRLDMLSRATELLWWNAQTEMKRDSYRYRASVVLEAVDELKGLKDAAE